MTSRDRSELAAERFRALVEASAQIVWTTDPDGRVTEDSPSWRTYTGQTLDAWMESRWLEMIHPADREPTRVLWSQALSASSAFRAEYRLWHVSGEHRWTMARAVPVFTNEGDPREWVGMMTDITDRKQRALAQPPDRCMGSHPTRGDLSHAS